jgi:hypothetical protein
MQRDTKLGYGFLLVGAALPFLVDKVLGLVFAIFVSVSFLVTGIGFLIAGHRHNENSPPWRPKLQEGLAIGASGATLIVLISLGLIRLMPRKEIVKMDAMAFQRSEPPEKNAPVAKPVAKTRELKDPIIKTGHAQPTYSVTNPTGSIINQDSKVEAPQTIINGPPPIEVGQRMLSQNKRSDGIYETLIAITTSSSVPELYVEVRGRTMGSVLCLTAIQGTTWSQSVPVAAGMASCKFTNASNNASVSIRSTEPEEFAISHNCVGVACH